MRIFLSLILIFLTHSIYSQCVTGTPPTLNCGTPITVASNTPSGLYGSASVGNPSCAISGDKITDGDLYAVEYQPGKVISVDMCLTIGNYISILSPDGCTELACSNYGTSFDLDNTACNGNRTTTISMDDLGLTPGTIYYVKVQSVANCGGSPCSSASIGGRSYTIECETLLANSCSNNQVLSGNATYSICNNGSADNSGSNDSESGLCGYSIENNLMYKWCTDASNTPVTLDIQNLVIESGTSVQFAILQGSCGGPYTTIQCNSGIATDQLIPIGGTSANTCYWIMFDGNAGSTFCADIIMVDATTLPVELLYFDGESKMSYNLLTWATASEANSHHFLLERSYDVQSWEYVGTKDAAGNSNTVIEYSFKDFKIKNSITYYRLTQYDYDGKYEVFRIIAIDNTEDFANRKIEVVYNLLGENITDRHEKYYSVKVIVYDDGFIEKVSTVLDQ